MYTIKVVPCTDSWYWDSDEWKDFVCEDFDQNVVIVGNRENAGVEEAEWWRDADRVSSELDYANDYEDFLYALEDEFPSNTLQAIWDLYLNDNMVNDEFRFEVAKILHPELQLESGTIRGSVQREWAYVYYVEGSVDLDVLADWYFGNVLDVELYDENGEYQECTTLPDSTIFSMRFAKGGDYKADIAELFGLSPDEIIIEEDS